MDLDQSETSSHSPPEDKIKLTIVLGKNFTKSKVNAIVKSSPIADEDPQSLDATKRRLAASPDSKILRMAAKEIVIKQADSRQEMYMVLSGGHTIGTDFASEARTMVPMGMHPPKQDGGNIESKEYAVGNNTTILLEDGAMSTTDNIQNTIEMLRSRNQLDRVGSVQVVAVDYHAARAGDIVQRELAKAGLHDVNVQTAQDILLSDSVPENRRSKYQYFLEKYDSTWHKTKERGKEFLASAFHQVDRLTGNKISRWTAKKARG